MRSRFGRHALALFVVALAVAAGCSSNTSQSPRVYPTAPPIPTQAAFTATQSVIVNAAATPIPLATGSGFSGTTTFVGANAPGVTLTETTSNTAPAGAPQLLGANRDALAARQAEYDAPSTAFLYLTLTASATFVIAEPPSFSVNVPAADILSNTTYYLAFYDPTRPTLGWQEAYATGAIAGSTLTFVPAQSGLFAFTANTTYAFALYAIASGVPAPTQAPSSTVIATPTPTPTPTPVPTPTPAPTPGPVVLTSSATQVAVGASQAFTASETLFGGAFTQTTSCNNGPGSSGTVGTVTPASATPTTTGGTASFTFTGVNPGTCMIAITGATGRTSTITFTVNSTNLGVN